MFVANWHNHDIELLMGIVNLSEFLSDRLTDPWCTLSSPTLASEHGDFLLISSGRLLSTIVANWTSASFQNTFIDCYIIIITNRSFTAVKLCERSYLVHFLDDYRVDLCFTLIELALSFSKGLM